MQNRAWLADEDVLLDELVDHGLLCLVRVLTSDQGVGVGVDTVRCVRQHAAIAADDRTHLEAQLAPPRDVGGVAERADHGDAGALVGLR